MNNEEKEWLRDRVNRWADSDLRHYEGSESVCHDVQQDRYALIALIDRVPTEGEMHSIKVALEQIYGAFDYDAPGFKAIRKALGVEEDKCQK
uniref:Uncharacterized protein n=1 Tax=viral metagenome TaxID=1070528 RepID=A0A6M3LAV4_9ZZZZ